MSKDAKKIGGYWVINNSMTRQVISYAHNTRTLVLESAAHADREGPNGKKGLNTRKTGDLFYVPEGDKGLHKIADQVPGLMQYDGPLEGMHVHCKIGDETKIRVHESMTADEVALLPDTMLTTPEAKKRKEAKAAEKASKKKTS